MPTSLTGFNNFNQPPAWANFQDLTQPSILGYDAANQPVQTFSPGDGKTGGGGWNWFDSTDPITGQKTQGALLPSVGAATGIFNAWMGMKQYGLAKDALAAGKQQFALNYDAQRTTTNAELQDRQAARVASNPGAYQSVGDYMAANAIKPRTGF